MQFRQCGYDIQSGKRFCRQCGTAAPDSGSEAAAAVTEVEQEPSARWGTSAGREASPGATPEGFGYKYSADEGSDFQSSSDRTSHRRLFVLLAAVLVAGALGWGWYAVSGRSSKPTTTASQIPPPGAAAALGNESAGAAAGWRARLQRAARHPGIAAAFAAIIRALRPIGPLCPAGRGPPIRCNAYAISRSSRM